MKILHITVTEKKAIYRERDGEIVCGNSDYIMEFAFDSEWASYETKTARFVWNGEYVDVIFTGDTCSVPIVRNTTLLSVGVYAGNLCTTTPAQIGCQKSILCDGGLPQAPGDDVYAQLMAKYNELSERISKLEG